MIAQIGLTVLLLWVIAYAWAEYRRAPLIGPNASCGRFRPAPVVSRIAKDGSC